MLKHAALFPALLLLSLSVRAQNGNQATGKDIALSQMRRIVEAIKQCPEKPPRDLAPEGAVQKFSRPQVLDWDVVSKPDSLRSSFQGFVRFRIVAHVEESEAAKRSKQLDAQYQKFTLAKKWCDEEHHASCDVTEYRYDFGLGTDAPELRKASMSIAINKEPIVYEPKDDSCWDKIAKSPESVLAGSHEQK